MIILFNFVLYLGNSFFEKKFDLIKKKNYLIYGFI